jgi:hypothetical protein
MTSLAPDISMRQDSLSQIERESIDKFILEYVYDKDAEKAALRCGISKTYAKGVAQSFIDTQYFQLRIKDYETNKDVLLDDMELLRRELVRNLLDIVKYNGADVAQSARIAAAKEVTALMGLTTSKTGTQEDEFKSGVMIVPASLGVDEWSAQAMQSQTELHAKLEASL